MKPSLLRLLVCPGCGSGLDLRVSAWSGAEALTGGLDYDYGALSA